MNTFPLTLQLAVCDYPEHVPPDRWTTYARQQKALGLTCVRVAEFAWSRLEPREGEFDWSWLDRAIETIAAEGLKVVLCTPTATPPAWLVRAHPEILPVDRDGRVREFGSRRHYDFASEVYRSHSRRITREMARRYGQHEALVGWQTDNEFGCHDTARSYGGASAAAFPGWLQRRYKTLDALNQAWGNVFWSMEYTDWMQILPPNQTVTEPNPAHVLDYHRFASDLIAEFQEEQTAIVREFSPERWITHNFMIFEAGFDHYRVSETLDFPSWDNYPTGMLEFFGSWLGEDLKTRFARTGLPDAISFNHDLYRGLKAPRADGAPGAAPARGFWVMEQQCGQVNWAPYNPLPADGAVQLWTAQAWAHGADGVSYFRWRAATMAQEALHSGLLRHDETPDRGFVEIEGLNREDFLLGEVPARVALLHDYESLWILDQQGQGGPRYWAQAYLYYCALRELGLDVDIVHPDAALEKYRLVVAPALTLISDARLAKLQRDAQGRLFVFGPRSAFRTASGRAHENGQFGDYKAFFGARLLNFESLRPGLSVQAGGHDTHTWAEGYEPAGADTLAVYGPGPLAGQAAAVRQGNVVTIGAHSPGLVQEVVQRLATEAGLETAPLPAGVRLSRRSGRTLVTNWNPETVTWNGRDLPAVSWQLL
ncbi:beta-galactosidase [Deinococcus peraridilitoris]|uniref:Beta-galactosidase n=1 Tax=Deinococcus peraridilitoris (strain DSM 19664 / LMG 22246 / CIP 109416 / KR-200) TaxID=937777 RepID=K9ZWD2_DEIPD|nr:beta-galactosidase [Deinococcus peraridilitoris]AFZ65953.1 beta-galactosidase [Deinococcus peraridilitoris DSM 19664]